MGKFGEIFTGLKKARWSPPLHSTMEISAPSQLRPESQSRSGDITPILLSSSSSTSSLPQYKPPSPSQMPTPPSRLKQLLKKTRSFKLLDGITNVAGSRLVFLGTLLLLLLWTILGIVLGPSDVWQIVMQNASSIQCYISDTLLMRQQQNTTRDFLISIAEMRSRSSSCLRMLRSLSPSQLRDLKDKNQPVANSNPSITAKSKRTPLFDRVSDTIALATGSLPALLLYLTGIATWLSLGPMLSWSNLWQLYINTAVAVELTFTSMFLQNVRRRHSTSLASTLASIQRLDEELERRLRLLTGDTEPNPAIVVAPPETGRMERAIDVYAYVVGSGVGVVLTAIVVSTWLALGKLLMFNSNWWLIIGTYTGLVGFVDGFVLRNVYFRQSAILETHLCELVDADRELCAVLGVRVMASGFDSGEAGEGEEGGTSGRGKKGLGLRISEAMIYYCALPSAVISSVVVVFILLAIATGLRWSETGQLLCNSPTMIVEGFLLLVLFSAHNLGNERRRECVSGVERRRVRIGALFGDVGVGEKGEESESESVVSLGRESVVVEVKS